jgi:hypothetical protein
VDGDNRVAEGEAGKKTRVAPMKKKRGKGIVCLSNRDVEGKTVAGGSKEEGVADIAGLLNLSFTNQESDATRHAQNCQEVIMFPIWDEMAQQGWIQPRIQLSEERTNAAHDGNKQRRSLLRINFSHDFTPPEQPACLARGVIAHSRASWKTSIAIVLQAHPQPPPPSPQSPQPWPESRNPIPQPTALNSCAIR